MSNLKNAVCETLESFGVRVAIAALSLGWVPCYFLSLAHATLTS